MVSDGRGLSLDILPSGKMSWLYRYCLDGKYGKVNLGHYPDLPLRTARERRDELAGKVAKGESPAMEKKLARAGMATNPTVKEFGERYYKEQVMRRWKDPKAIRRYLDNEIFPTLGEKALKEVNALDVQALVYRKRDNGRAQAAMQLRNVIKQMFAYAIETQLVTVNPAVMVATRYIGKTRKRSRVLIPKEIRLYLRTIYQSNIRRQFKLALHIILLTLSRKSELLLARWEHVKFESGEWLIPEENAKTGKPHIVYMSTQVAEMFRELKALAGDSDLVLPGRGSLTRPFATNALNKALEGLTFDMDPLTIHDLRRTGATLLTEHGFNRDVIEKALSHEAQGIRAVYIVAEYAEQRKKMLQWWADYVDGIMNESKVIVGNFGAIA
jgi:integrase